MISPYRRRRLRPEELPADADRAGRLPQRANRASGEGRRAAPTDLPRHELSAGQPSPQPDRARTAPARWLPRFTRRCADVAHRSVSDALHRPDRSAHGIANYPRTGAAGAHGHADPGFMRTPWEHVRPSRSNPPSTNWLTSSTGSGGSSASITSPRSTPLTNLPFSSRHVGGMSRARREALRLEQADDGARLTARQGRHADRLGRVDGRLPGYDGAADRRDCGDRRGTATIGVGGHEMGQGIRNVVAAVSPGSSAFPMSASPSKSAIPAPCRST